MRLDHAKGAAPLYAQLTLLLREQIESGVYDDGDRLPTEAELQRDLGVSRITVRQALGELEREGVVERRRGLGTTVRRPRFDEPLNRIKSFTEEMRLLGREPQTLSVDVGFVAAPRAAARALDVAPGQEVLNVTRVRAVQGEPVVQFVTHFVPGLGLSERREDYAGSVYEYLHSLGIVITTVRETFEAVAMPPDVAKALGVPARSPGMRRVRLSIDQRERKIEHTVCHYRGDRYRYHVSIG